jgi:protein SCO1/2
MKNTICAIALCLWILSLASCQDKGCCNKNMAEKESAQTEISAESIFDLESKWVTQSKDSIFFKDLSDKITVAAMVFTHCGSACPRIVADMQRIEKALSPAELQQVQFLLISMDPARDTPERFIEFSETHQLNDNWTGISANDDATMEIANVLNVRVKRLSDGGFDHSNAIHLIDRNGNIVFQQNGLAQEPDEMIKKIKNLLK